MRAEEIANDILVRCWWRPEDHPGEPRPPFAGLDKEIIAALRDERRQALRDLLETFVAMDGRERSVEGDYVVSQAGQLFTRSDVLEVIRAAMEAEPK